MPNVLLLKTLSFRNEVISDCDDDDDESLLENPKKVKEVGNLNLNEQRRKGVNFSFVGAFNVSALCSSEANGSQMTVAFFFEF